MIKSAPILVWVIGVLLLTQATVGNEADAVRLQKRTFLHWLSKDKHKDKYKPGKPVVVPVPVVQPVPYVPYPVPIAQPIPVPVVYTCPPNQSLNKNTNRCECDIGKVWNGVNCVDMPKPQPAPPAYVPPAPVPPPTYVPPPVAQPPAYVPPQTTPYKPYNPPSPPACPQGQQWNYNEKKCDCPIGYVMNGNTCAELPRTTYVPPAPSYTAPKTCAAGQTYNEATKQCESPTYRQYSATAAAPVSSEAFAGAARGHIATVIIVVVAGLFL
ncbi:hypothetical protein BKA69DRAFT_1125939 [Paraphysoderma sedebokerense]|nr:hypothetical protein BKA69DRAFT_1125939 [Paraphysoderma sedebokerense]